MASQAELSSEPLCLHVMVVSASGLFKKDLFGLCDPYVKVTLKRKNKNIVLEQTKKKKKTLNPTWSEKFIFKDINLKDDSLLFEVFDENRLTRDNFLGKLHFKLQHIPIEMKKIDIAEYPRSATYPLKPRSLKSRVSGSLCLKFLYYNNPPSRMGSATLMGELNLASLVEGATGRSSPQAPSRAQGGGASAQNPSGSIIARQDSTTDWQIVDNTDEDPLPEGWEERQDANGRSFYVDHINRRTQWTRPTRSAEVGARQRRAQHEADRRRMMAQTLARRNPGMSGADSMLDLNAMSLNNGSPHSVSRGSSVASEGSPQPPNPRNSIAVSTPSTGSTNSAGMRSSTPSIPAALPPALPPRATSSSNVSIPRLPPPPSRNSPASSLSPRRPSNPSSPLTTSVPVPVPTVPSSPPVATSANSGSAEEQLPHGWEKRVATNGRAFYIDHNTRKTQWTRPTMPSLSARPRPQSAILPSTTVTTFQPALPNGGTATLNTPSSSSAQTTPTAQTTQARSTPPSLRSNEDLGPLPSGWEMRELSDGRKFYIEHATRSTQWEDPRLQIKKQQEQQAATATPQSRDYKVKYENLRKHFTNTKPADLPRVFEIPVRRQHLFEDSHRAIMSCKNKNHLKARLWVKFDGEKGLDYGGVSREWFFLLSHEMFNPYYGLFEYAASDNYTLQVNPESGLCNENHLEYFRFIGRILAMAIYHQRLIDAFFVRPFYKMLSGKRVVLSDMEMVDTEFYNSIKYILENDPEPLCLTFTANREFAGQVDEVELKPGGTDIEVTESNKKEYIDLLMKWRFENRITKQMEALKKGFSDVISIKLLAPFDSQEIEYLMCGIGEINVEDWRKHTVYAAGYKPNDDVIIWFWKAVTNFDNELRARLLQFVTGTSKVPMNGFAELQGSNGPQKFCIKKLGDPTSLPRSHTCFNRIDLPPYRSYHELKEKLKVAIENTEGFEGVD